MPDYLVNLGSKYGQLPDEFELFPGETTLGELIVKRGRGNRFGAILIKVKDTLCPDLCPEILIEDPQEEDDFGAKVLIGYPVLYGPGPSQKDISELYWKRVEGHVIGKGFDFLKTIQSQVAEAIGTKKIKLTNDWLPPSKYDATLGVIYEDRIYMSQLNIVKPTSVACRMRIDDLMSTFSILETILFATGVQTEKDALALVDVLEKQHQLQSDRDCSLITYEGDLSICDIFNNRSRSTPIADVLGLAYRNICEIKAGEQKIRLIINKKNPVFEFRSQPYSIDPCEGISHSSLTSNEIVRDIVGRSIPSLCKILKTKKISPRFWSQSLRETAFPDQYVDFHVSDSGIQLVLRGTFSSAVTSLKTVNDLLHLDISVKPVLDSILSETLKSSTLFSATSHREFHAPADPTASKVLARKDVKKLAKQMQRTLGDMGHEIPLGHFHEMLAKVAGYREWDSFSAFLN